jgi:hypothetical protein
MARNELPMSNWSNTQLTLLLIIALLTSGC